MVPTKKRFQLKHPVFSNLKQIKTSYLSDNNIFQREICIKNGRLSKSLKHGLKDNKK